MNTRFITSLRQVDLGGFTAFFAALLTAAQSLRQVANLSTVLSQGLTAARRLLAALDIAPAIQDAPGATPLAVSDAVVELQNVTFSYGGEPVLDGVSLSARRGETVCCDKIAGRAARANE